MNNVIQDKATDNARVNLPVLEVEQIAAETKRLRTDSPIASKVSIDTSSDFRSLIDRIGVEVAPVTPTIASSLIERMRLNVPGIETIARATMRVVKATATMATTLISSVFRQVKTAELEDARVDQVRQEEHMEEVLESERLLIKVVAESTPESRVIESVDGNGKVLAVQESEVNRPVNASNPS